MSTTPIVQTLAAVPTLFDMKGRLGTVENIRKFVYAGNATITIRSIKTQDRFTFKIRKARANPRFPGEAFFVSVLTGPDYYNALGMIKSGAFRRYAGTQIGIDAPSYKAFNWFFDNVLTKGKLREEVLQVWHEGRCGRCGRQLTVPESIERGIGPDCINKM